MEIEKLAKLVRINLSSEEKEKLEKEFEAILGYISAAERSRYGRNIGGRENGNGECFKKRRKRERGKRRAEKFWLKWRLC